MLITFIVLKFGFVSNLKEAMILCSNLNLIGTYLNNIVK